MHQHPGKQRESGRDSRRREADRRAQRQRGLHQGRAAALFLRRRHRPGAGRAAGAEDPALVIVPKKNILTLLFIPITGTLTSNQQMLLKR